MIDQIRCRRRQGDAGASVGLAALVVCQTHTTDRNYGGVAMVWPLDGPTDSKVSFSDGYPARWSCLLFKTSGEPLFSRILI